MVKTRGKKIDYSALDGDLEDSTIAPREAPQAKRRRVSRKNNEPFVEKAHARKSTGGTKGPRKSGGGRSRIGKLEGLMQMPVDIFTEICQYLLPLDILHLARTTKRLREILMNKQCRSIWTRSMKLLEAFPECPPDLSEPQYISLMLETGCMSCEAQTRKTHYITRSRFCADCFNSHFSSTPSFWNSLPPFARDKIIGLPVVAADDILANPGRGRRHGIYYPNALIERVRGLLPKTEDPEALARILELGDMLKETGIAMEGWKWKEADERRMVSNDKIARRRAAITERLLAEGWEEQDIPWYDMEFALKPAELTDRVWNNLHPKVRPLLERTRADRLAFEKTHRRHMRRHQLLTYCSDWEAELEATALNPRSWHLRGDELFSIPPVKQLFETDTETVSREQWNSVLPAVMAKSEEVNNALRSSLLDIVAAGLAKSHKEEEPEGKGKGKATGKGKGKQKQEQPAVANEDLTLATTIFICTECPKPADRPLWYSTIFDHDHCTPPASSTSLHSTSGGTIRSTSCLKLADDKTRAIAARLLHAVPEKDGVLPTSFEAANDVGKMWQCTRCDIKLGVQRSFAEMLRHYVSEQQWFERAMDERLNNAKLAYPGYKKSELPELCDTHSLEDQAPLAKVLVEEDLQAILVAKAALYEEYLDEEEEQLEPFDEMYDSELSDSDIDDYFFDAPFVSSPLSLYTCELCPKTIQHEAMRAAEMAIHIKQRHLKEDPDLQQDAKPYRSPLSYDIMDYFMMGHMGSMFGF